MPPILWYTAGAGIVLGYCILAYSIMTNVMVHHPPHWG